MIKTPIRLFQFAGVREANREAMSPNHYIIEEVMMWLEGKPVDRRTVIMGLSEIVDYGTIRDFITDHVSVPELPEEDPFTIIASDGVEIATSRGSLMRRFQLIGDYLSEFPDEVSMRIPYDSSILAPALFCPRGIALKEVDECLCYLNPTSSIYYFYFDTKGAKPHRLAEVARSCSEDEIESILNVRKLMRQVALPRHGRGVCFLGRVLEAYKDIENAKAIFAEYPSYLTSMCIAMDDFDNFSHLILTADYSVSKEYNHVEIVNNAICRLIIRYTLAKAETKQEVERVANMIDPPTNESRVTAPYREYVAYRLSTMKIEKSDLIILARAESLLYPDGVGIPLIQRFFRRD